MRHATFLAVLLIAAGVAAPPAAAAEVKIGYVNSERVLREATPAKAALARMESDFQKRQKDLADQGAKLKAAADKFAAEKKLLSGKSEQQAA